MTLLQNSTNWLAPEQRQRAEAILAELQRRRAESRPAWRSLARPEQILPLGDWRTWLILAGRGWGKTRTGAEAVREWKETNPRIGIIAPTYADARDICVEGDSGLRGICANGEVAKWNRSLGELEFSNGARAKLFSADEPDRLRGPQHYKLWADELGCLVADTLVTMANGSEKRIVEVVPGDYVATRMGPRRVVNAWRTHASAVVYRLSTSDGKQLVGTGNHPVWVKGCGFVPLRDVQYGSILNAWDINQALYGEAVAGGSMAAITATGKAGYCTAPSTPPHMGLFPLGATSTTLTATKPITPSKTLKRSPAKSISSAIARQGGERSPQKSAHGLPIRFGKSANPMMLFAPGAVWPLSAPEPALSFAAPIAGCDFTNALASSSASLVSPKRHEYTNHAPHSHVSFAGNSSNAPIPVLSPVPAPAATSIVVGVERLTLPAAVYDLEVDGTHEFYANRILVHNSWKYPTETWDMAMFGLRLGDNPQAVVTTTPRPVKVIRDLLTAKSTRLQRGRTYDNRPNLAAAFFEQIVTRYEGTRLGRQELEAELLEDVPGALWRREELDAHRVSVAPELVRIVTAIDPSATSGDTSDEAGIVTAGKGWCSCRGEPELHGFVLADDSKRDAPQGWATAALDAYERHHGDRILGEGNNGGEMVETVLRSVAAVRGISVPYSMVWASRGKWTRAEPISALYAQGKVHHVGTLASLEDEYCTWIQGEGRSPNRLDAAVWALTELLGSPSGDDLVAW